MNGTPIQLHLRFVKDSGKQTSFTFWKIVLVDVNFEANRRIQSSFQKLMHSIDEVSKNEF